MNVNNKQIWKISALASAISSVMFAGSLQAQESQNEGAEEEQIERIVLTGSRIARDPNLASPSPVQSIDAEDIALSGELSITDIVNDIPALFSSINGESSKDNGPDFADGSNVLNLRGLGAARTLVLVNGRRHVAGVEGTGAVDVGSIPTKLVKSVEVLTGGASAVYGADAVTGVVNFILKDDFEGFELDVQHGMSKDGEGAQTQITGTYGFNFDDDRGNFAVSVEYTDDKGLRASDITDGVLIGSGDDGPNPAFRLQQSDLASNIPNLAQFYTPSNGFSTFGHTLPSQSDFIADFTDTFGVAPSLTADEQAIFDRAANAFPRAIMPGYTFGITNAYGQIAPGDAARLFQWFDGALDLSFGEVLQQIGFDPDENIDINNNGIPDCLDSFTGFNSSLNGFGAIGGCWQVQPDGSYGVVEDGTIASTLNSFGGYSYNAIQQPDNYILNPEEKISVNMIGSYDITDDLLLTAELKYASQELTDIEKPVTFWDYLTGYADNPYLPAFIQPVADRTGAVQITVDPVFLGDGRQDTDRETIRSVLGLEGSLDNGWGYNFSAVWGRFKRETTLRDNLIVDRFLAAVDAVTGPDGNPACRVDVDPSAPLTGSPTGLPTFDNGYYTFTPGANQCRPLNIWAGAGGVSQEALDWVSVTTTDSIELEQTVLSAGLNGDMDNWVELPAGSVMFAVGAEYREEKSEALFDAWQTGVLPQESTFGAGTNIADVSSNNSTIFDPEVLTRDEKGKYDVWEIYGEVSIPLLEGETLAEELTLELAARYSDYSSIGETTTWKANVIWAPIEDLTLRTSFSQAVRAPNVTELFGPSTGITISKDDDICDISKATTANIQNNCETDLLAAGVAASDIRDGNGDYIWANPLTARFSGVSSGNRELTEETADTQTIGLIYRPEWLDGFDFTIDYFSIEIEDAINEVQEDIIIETCYSGASLNETFCSLFERNTSGATTGGLRFLRNSPINFAKRETTGFDFSAAYTFSLEEHDFGITVNGTKVNKLNDFTNPLDLTEVDPELFEIFRPEWAGNIFLDWKWGDLTVAWQTQFMGKQLLGQAEIEEVFGYGCEVEDNCVFGPEIMQDEFWQHDVSVSYVLDENMTFYGGVKNITDEKPFFTEFAYPASPRGRYMFLGMTVKI